MPTPQHEENPSSTHSKNSAEVDIQTTEPATLVYDGDPDKVTHFVNHAAYEDITVELLFIAITGKSDSKVVINLLLTDSVITAIQTSGLALETAATHNKINMANVLLKHQTPSTHAVFIALYKGFSEMALLLLKHIPTDNSAIFNDTLLHRIVRSNIENAGQIIDFLILEKGMRAINSPDAAGRSPLSYATGTARAALIKYGASDTDLNRDTVHPNFALTLKPTQEPKLSEDILLSRLTTAIENNYYQDVCDLSKYSQLQQLLPTPRGFEILEHAISKNNFLIVEALLMAGAHTHIESCNTIKAHHEHMSSEIGRLIQSYKPPENNQKPTI